MEIVKDKHGLPLAVLTEDVIYKIRRGMAERGRVEVVEMNDGTMKVFHLRRKEVK